MFRLEEEHARSSKQLNASVYMYVGGKENNDSQKAMIDNMLLYAQKLRSRQHKGLDLNATVLKGETHGSAFPILLVQALKDALPKR